MSKVTNAQTTDEYESYFDINDEEERSALLDGASGVPQIYTFGNKENMQSNNNLVLDMKPLQINPLDNSKKRSYAEIT